MESLVAATLVGMALFVWLRKQVAWYLALAVVGGLLTKDDWILMAGLWIGLGLAWYREACQLELRRDKAEQAALLFVVRLRQLLGVKGSLAGALDDMGYRSGWAGGDASERVLTDIAGQIQVATLSFLARVALIIRRHGGSLQPVADWVSGAIQNAHGIRQARRLEEATQRSTILILALAPVGVVGVFRLLVPSFYRALCTSQLGDGTILFIGICTFGVLAVLAHHIQKEARAR